MLTWFSIKISSKQFIEGHNFHKINVKEWVENAFIWSRDSSETSHRNSLKQKLILSTSPHEFPMGRHLLWGYMSRKLEKSQNFNMILKTFSASVSVIMKFWAFMLNTSFNSYPITFEKKIQKPKELKGKLCFLWVWEVENIAVAELWKLFNALSITGQTQK